MVRGSFRWFDAAAREGLDGQVGTADDWRPGRPRDWGGGDGCARLTAGAVDALEAALAWAGPYLPFISRVVAGNMRSAGLYSPQAHRDYFAYVAAHLGGVLHVLRYAGRAGSTPAWVHPECAGRMDPECAGRMDPELERLVRERVLLDGSFDCLRQAAAGGKGVVLLGVHASNYMLVVARINRELPITVYLRHCATARKQEAKRAWCRAAGVDFIAEPPSLLNPSRRAELMAAALRAGSHSDRYSRPGPETRTRRAGAISWPRGLSARRAGGALVAGGGAAGHGAGRCVPRLCEPCRTQRDARKAEHGSQSRGTHLLLCGSWAPVRRSGRTAAGWRQAAVRERLQWFADVFASECLRPCPALWFLWGDKRWGRVFRGDPRYTAPLHEDATMRVGD